MHQKRLSVGLPRTVLDSWGKTVSDNVIALLTTLLRGNSFGLKVKCALHIGTVMDGHNNEIPLA